MKEFAVYTLARLGLFVASFALVAGVWRIVAGGVPIVWPFLIAVVVSAFASYYLLKGPRERFAVRVQERAAAASARFEAARSKEDREDS